MRDDLLREANELYAEGRAAEAANLLQSALRANPGDPAATNLLGLCLIAQGKAKEAETAFRQLLVSNPNEAAVHANLGLALRLQNRGEEALAEFRAALELDPFHPPNHLQLFKQLQRLSLWNEAVEALEAGVSKIPSSITLIEALATAYGRLGRKPEAEALFREIAPKTPNAANAFADWLQEEGRFDEAAEVLALALSLNPNQGAPYRKLAEMKISEVSIGGKKVSLLAVALEASQNPALTPFDRMHIAYALGKLYDRDKNYKEAMRWFDEANALAYDFYPATKTFDPAWTEREPELIAEIYTEEFFASLRREARWVRGHPGRIRSGLEARAPSALRAGGGQPIFIVGMIRSGTTLLDQMISAHPDVASVGEPTFWNAESDRLHKKWKQTPPTKEELQELRERYLASINLDSTRPLGPLRTSEPSASSEPSAPFEPSEPPGTMEPWHPGTLNDPSEPPEPYETFEPSAPFEPYEPFEPSRTLRTSEAPGTITLFTDKMPLNYRNLGPIHAVFPEARILHIRRDPFDTCISIYQTFFAGGPSFAYKQENIVTFYRAYLRYLEHWRSALPPDRFFELDYEDLVREPEKTIRSALDFLGLPWDDACLRPNENREQIATPSRWQARQPIYGSSVGKRDRYGPFALALVIPSEAEGSRGA